jgi:hypothetical protein
MTQQTRIRFGQMYLLVSDGATPVPAFIAPCGISTFGRSVTTTTQDVELMDCDDPDAPIWMGLDVTSKRMTLTLSGTLDNDAYVSVWKDWFMDEGTRAIRVYENLGAPNSGYWEGMGVLTEYSDTATGRGSYTNTATIIFDGKPVWVPVP